MRVSPHFWRLALFCGASLALISAALLFSESGDDLSRPSPSAPLALAGGTARPPSEAALRSQAELFLGVFFRYEVGDLDRRLRRGLRRTASAGFASALLRERPRLPSRAPRPARIAYISLRAMPVSPPRALVSGAAKRGRSAEQFSFVFELRSGKWLAIGPGQ